MGKGGIRMTLGQILKEYRKATHTTMETFAENSGITRGYISMLERNVNPATGKGITPSIETVAKVAKGMGISLDDLLNRMDKNSIVSIADAPDGWQLLTKEEKQRVQNFVTALLVSKGTL